MAKDYARSFYKSRAWQKTQAAYMTSQYYVCENCGGAARIVHHIIYITPSNITDPAVTLDWMNLQALCVDCHNAEHMGAAICAEGLRFNLKGELIRTDTPLL
jgi:5-methylcytosine-specific restriction endonuclease McrA